MKLFVESDLDGEENRTVLCIDGNQNSSFLDAVLDTHRKISSPLKADVLRSEDEHTWLYEIRYVIRPEEFHPGAVLIPEETTIGTVAEFFGSDVTRNPPLLRVYLGRPRGGDGFYPAEVTLEIIRLAFELYGYALAGKALLAFAARRWQRVPFEAIRQWQNTGVPPETLIEYVRRWHDTNPIEVGRLLDVEPSRCVELLQLAGFKQLTDSGDHWYRRHGDLE